ncbi:unnamed protein product [Brassica oleracea]
MTLVDLLFVSKLMQQKVTKNEKCVRNIASYEGLSLENESLGLVLENQSSKQFLSPLDYSWPPGQRKEPQVYLTDLTLRES